MSTTESVDIVDTPSEPVAPEAPAPVSSPPKARGKSSAAAGKEFVVESADLVPALNAATRATANGEVESLRSIRLSFANSRLTVAGTDNETGISVKIPVKGRSTAVAFVEARLLGRVAKALEGDEVTLIVTDDDLIVKAGAFRASLRNRDGDGFTFPKVPTAKAKRVPAFEFLAATTSVTHAASDDDARPILTGVLLEAENGKLTLAATDSFRLAVNRPGIAWAGKPAIVPADVLADVARLVTEDDEHIEISVDAHRIAFELGDDCVVTARLIDGEYPPYAKLLPAPKDVKHTVVIDRAALIASVKRVRLLADANAVRLNIGKGKVRVASSSDEVGTADETLDATITGTPCTVSFNAEYLAEGLSTFADDEVTISIVEPMKPATIDAGHRNQHVLLLMPIRVS